MVENGAIIGSQDIPNNGGIVITDKAYGDFEVALEMNNDFVPDSGLFLRSTERGQAYQYMIDYHAGGNLAGVYGEGLSGGIHRRNFSFLDEVTKIKADDSPFPLPFRPRPGRAFGSTANGTNCGLGSWATRQRSPPGSTACGSWSSRIARSGTPDTGGIALQVHGGGGDLRKQFVRYRKVRVKELK